MINADSKLIFADLTYKVRGCIFTVYNAIGSGHKEEVYQKALAREFELQQIAYEREKSLAVAYKEVLVGHYRPDFVVDNRLILELKAVEFMPKSYELQLLHYLKSTNYSLGLLINFGAPTLSIKRLVWSPASA